MRHRWAEASLLLISMMTSAPTFGQSNDVYDADLTEWKPSNITPRRASASFANDHQSLQTSVDLYGMPPGAYELVVHSGTNCETEAKAPTPALAARARVVVDRN